jgi:hypothetical protein
MTTVQTACKTSKVRITTPVLVILTNQITQLILKRGITSEEIHPINLRKVRLTKTLFKIPKIMGRKYLHRIISRGQITLFRILVWVQRRNLLKEKLIKMLLRQMQINLRWVIIWIRKEVPTCLVMATVRLIINRGNPWKRLVLMTSTRWPTKQGREVDLSIQVKMNLLNTIKDNLYRKITFLNCGLQVVATLVVVV